MDNLLVLGKNSPPSGEMLEQIYSLMERSFPSSERHSLRVFSGQFAREEFRSLCLWDGALYGFLNLWDFGEFVYFEHFAVEPSLRGRGTGTMLIKEALRLCGGKIVVLEAEPRELGETAERRLSFYGRIGFKENPYPYIQPSMQEGEPPVPLVILSAPDILDEAGFMSVKNTLYRQVYGAKKGASDNS